MFIKEADIKDMMDIYKWKNDPLSLKMSKNKSKISINEHKNWFKNIVIDHNSKIYIGVTENNKIGVTRFELNKYKNEANTSINLNPLMRGRNLSFDLLSKSMFLYLKKKKIRLVSSIKKENIASLKIFLKCGFIINNQDKIFHYLRYNKK